MKIELEKSVVKVFVPYNGYWNCLDKSLAFLMLNGFCFKCIFCHFYF